MTDQHDIDNKDFSLDLPIIISKIKALSSGMVVHGENDGCTGEEMNGYGGILWDIAEDLTVINKTLYR